jgi:hypothetical protein
MIPKSLTVSSLNILKGFVDFNSSGIGGYSSVLNKVLLNDIGVAGPGAGSGVPSSFNDGSCG